MNVQKHRYKVSALISLLAIVLFFSTSVNPIYATSDNGNNDKNKSSVSQLMEISDENGKALDLKDLDRDKYDGYIFKLKDNVSEDYLSPKEIKETDGRIDDLDAENLYTSNSLNAIEDYIDLDKVEYIEPDYVVEQIGEVEADSQFLVPDDPQYSEHQWNLPMMKVDGAWKEQLYGTPLDSDEKREVKVAVVDSGLYGTGYQSSNPHEDFDYSKVDMGVNLVNNTPGTPDTSGHGTFVSGMIAAEANNGKGIAGIMPEVTIVPVKVFGSANSTSNSTVIEGVYQSVKLGADVINMSLGSAYDSISLEEACDYAANKGSLVVAAAGNDGKNINNYPAAYDSVVGVASLDSDGSPSYFSQYGESVFVAAPGGNVRSTYIGGESAYKTGSGTSFASPEIAAAGAMAKSIQPKIDQEGFKKIIEETSVDLGTKGFDIYYGWGLVNFEKMAENILKDRKIPSYNIDFQVKDEQGAKVDKPNITVKAAENIQWQDNKAENIKAGGLKKGQVVLPLANGTYKLNKGKYEYYVSKDDYYKSGGTFTTYKKNQTINVVLAKSYGIGLTIVDSDGDKVDDGKVQLEQAGGGIKDSITQDKNGKYKGSIPAGDYSYTVQVPGYEKSRGFLSVEKKANEFKIPMYTNDQLSRTSFNFTDSGTTQKLDNVTVEVLNQTGNKVIAESNGDFMLVKDEKITYTASKIGYEKLTQKIKISNVKSNIVNSKLEPTKFTVNINAQDSQGVLLDDVDVEVFDGQENNVEPSSSNNSKFNLDDGKYSYIVSKSGYGNEKGSFKVDGSSRNIKVVLSEVMKKVSFDIKGEDNLNINDFSVNVSDKSGKIMNRYADKSYRFKAGTYNYSVYKDGYKTTKGEFIVSEENLIVKDTLKLKDSESSEGDYEDGSGTAGDPYLISNEKQLQNLSKKTSIIYADDEDSATNVKKRVDDHYRLISDIDLTEPWNPIGNYESASNYNIFSGSFDGAGYSINGIDIDNEKDFVGLFGAIKGGEIKNTSVSGSISASEYAGGIVGCIFYDEKNITKIENCENNIDIIGGAEVGGICGGTLAEDSNKVNIFINSCSNRGDVKAASKDISYDKTNAYAGGIAGDIYAAKLSSCYNNGNITASYLLGGIAGNAERNTYINNCYSTGKTTPKTVDSSYTGLRGGIVGATSGNVNKTYFLSGTANKAVGKDINAEVYDASRKSSEDMSNNQSFVDELNLIEDISYSNYKATDTYPVFGWQSPNEKQYASKPEFLVQPEGNEKSPYIAGSPAKPLKAVLSNVSEDNQLTYQWYENDSNDQKTASKIKEASGIVPQSGEINYTPKTDDLKSTFYFVEVKNTYTSPTGAKYKDKVRSDVVQVVVKKGLAAQKPSIKKYGISGSSKKYITVKRDSRNKVAYVQSSVADKGKISYQWYISKYSDTKGTAIKGGTSVNCNLGTKTAGTYYYYVKVTNTVEDKAKKITDKESIKSERIKVTVTTSSVNDEKRAFSNKKIKIKKMKKGTKKAILYWNSIKDGDGYQIQHAKDKKLKKSRKTVTIRKAKTIKKTIKKLPPKKTRYFRIRAYKTIDGTKVYSKWSKVKKAKVK